MHTERNLNDFQDKVFRCPISLEIMTDPVVASDGHTYERDAIMDWIETKQRTNKPVTSPMTGKPLSSLELRSNIALRQLIQEKHPRIVRPKEKTTLDLTTLRHDRERRFSHLEWWKHQESLWNQASQRKHQDSGIQAALITNLNNNTSVDLIRMHFINADQEVHVPEELVTQAIESNDIERLELFVYRGIPLTLKNYASAIQANLQPDILSWIVDIINPTEISDLNSLQMLTARHGHDPDFVRSILNKTTIINYVVIAQAINNDSPGVFSVVLAKVLEQNNPNTAWYQIADDAVAQQRFAVLTAILDAWPETVPKPNDWYSKAVELLNREALEAFLNHQFPVSENLYRAALENIAIKYQALSRAITTNNNTFTSRNYRFNVTYQLEEFIGMTILLMGGIALFLAGCLYLTSVLNANITKHADDETDDSTHQKHANFKSGISCVVIGGCLNLYILCVCSQHSYPRRLISVFNEYSDLTSENSRLNEQINSLIANANQIFDSLEARGLPANPSLLNHAATVECPPEILHQLEANIRRQYPQEEESTNTCFSIFNCTKRQPPDERPSNINSL